MNKKIGLVVIILLLLGGGYYFMKMKPNTTTNNQSAGSAMSEAAQFAAAIASGKPTTCTLTKGSDSMQYHIKGKMMAADITSSEGGKSTLSHMINDTSYIYMWSDGQSQGTKMAIPTEEDVQAMKDKAQQYQSTAPKFEGEADYESFKNLGYTINCKASSVGDSVFTPPTNVEFIDPTAIIKQVTTPGSTGGVDMSKLEELQKQYGGMTPADE